jgi:hypothetical protein
MILRTPFLLTVVGDPDKSGNQSDLPLLASSPTAMLLKQNSTFKKVLNFFYKDPVI